MISFPTSFSFPETLDSLMPGTYFSTLGIFVIFVISFLGNLSGFTLFDDLSREDFDRVEPISMPGEKMFMFIGVEDGSRVTAVVAFGLSGGIPVAVALLVTGDVSHGISGAVSSVLKRFIFSWVCHLCYQLT